MSREIVTLGDCWKYSEVNLEYRGFLEFLLVNLGVEFIQVRAPGPPLAPLRENLPAIHGEISLMGGWLYGGSRMV
jgi:hypothetical protein